MELHGSAVPGWEAFDDLLRAFTMQHGVAGAALAVGRAGVIEYARSIGWADIDQQIPVEPHSLFRIASLSKPVTAIAIMRQVECGALSLEGLVWEFLKLDTPHDVRWKQVTVRHLLQHTGGWDRSASFDPMFRSVEFAAEAGMSPPADPSAIIRAMLRRPLDFDPGTRYAYSNFGYCLLGRVLESLPSSQGKSYEQLVREQVLTPVGALSPRIGRTLTTQVDEVRYYMPATGERVREDSVFAPGTPVDPPYGAWALEAMDSHGGWISSAPDMVRFAMGCDLPSEAVSSNVASRRPSLLNAASIASLWAEPVSYPLQDPNVWYACGWNVRRDGSGEGRNTWHLGALDGTSTLLVRRWDGMTWCVLFNQRKNVVGDELARLIDPLLHPAANHAYAALQARSDG